MNLFLISLEPGTITFTNYPQVLLSEDPSRGRTDTPGPDIYSAASALSWQVANLLSISPFSQEKQTCVAPYRRQEPVSFSDAAWAPIDGESRPRRRRILVALPPSPASLQAPVGLTHTTATVTYIQAAARGVLHSGPWYHCCRRGWATAVTRVADVNDRYHTHMRAPFSGREQCLGGGHRSLLPPGQSPMSYREATFVPAIRDVGLGQKLLR